MNRFDDWECVTLFEACCLLPDPAYYVKVDATANEVRDQLSRVSNSFPRLKAKLSALISKVNDDESWLPAMHRGWNEYRTLQKRIAEANRRSTP